MVIDFSAAWLPRKSAAYLCLYVAWLVTLWFLSAGNPGPKEGPEIPHLDKIAHFGYFFGGGGLLTGYLALRRPWTSRFPWRVFLCVVLVGTVVGRLDEYHQTFTPGRTGNDNYDWLADILGTLVGFWVMIRWVLPRLMARKKRSSEALEAEIVANTLD